VTGREGVSRGGTRGGTSKPPPDSALPSATGSPSSPPSCVVLSEERPGEGTLLVLLALTVCGVQGGREGEWRGEGGDQTRVRGGCADSALSGGRGDGEGWCASFEPAGS